MKGNFPKVLLLLSDVRNVITSMRHSHILNQNMLDRAETDIIEAMSLIGDIYGTNDRDTVSSAGAERNH